MVSGRVGIPGRKTVRTYVCSTNNMHDVTWSEDELNHHTGIIPTAASYRVAADLQIDLHVCRDLLFAVMTAVVPQSDLQKYSVAIRTDDDGRISFRQNSSCCDLFPRKRLDDVFCCLLLGYGRQFVSCRRTGLKVVSLVSGRPFTENLGSSDELGMYSWDAWALPGLDNLLWL